MESKKNCARQREGWRKKLWMKKHGGKMELGVTFMSNTLAWKDGSAKNRRNKNSPDVPFFSPLATYFTARRLCFCVLRKTYNNLTSNWRLGVVFLVVFEKDLSQLSKPHPSCNRYWIWNKIVRMNAYSQLQDNFAMNWNWLNVPNKKRNETVDSVRDISPNGSMWRDWNYWIQLL